MSKLLDAVDAAVRREEEVSVRAVVRVLGHRSFGPLLLLSGLIMAAPGPGDIPGMPTGIGVVVLLSAGQILVGRDSFWLPRWLLDRSISDERLCKMISSLRTPAQYIDRVLKPRITSLTNNGGTYAIALACSAIALATPFMELVVFSANIAGIALVAFGLALVAHDGVMALIAFLLTASTAAVIAYILL